MHAPLYRKILSTISARPLGDDVDWCKKLYTVSVLYDSKKCRGRTRGMAINDGFWETVLMYLSRKLRFTMSSERLFKQSFSCSDKGHSWISTTSATFIFQYQVRRFNFPILLCWLPQRSHRKSGGKGHFCAKFPVSSWKNVVAAKVSSGWKRENLHQCSRN